jgi:F0F1-type ATP synthase membrane subunit b/b'
METVLGIFTSLGANSTIVVQLGIFLVVFMFVLHVGAKPYFKAFEERQKRTQGNEKHAEQLVAQSRELEAMFQRKARGLNLDIKAIYDKERAEAQKEHERIIVEAKDKAKTILDKARGTILEQYNKAREELFKEAPAVGHSIAERLINKGPQ